MLHELRDVVSDKRYRSRKWWGFILLTVGLFALLMMGKENAELWVKWGSIGYPAFCAANAALKWKGVES